MKHTPGSWEVTKDELGVCEGIEPCDDYSIADCSSGLLARPSEECEANAHLIAAAPELLEACMGNMSYCRFQNTLKDLRDCSSHIDDCLSEEEHEARIDLYDLCKEIVDNCEREDLIDIEKEGK